MKIWNSVHLTQKKKNRIFEWTLDYWSKQSVKLGMSQWHLDSQVVKWPKLQLHPAAILHRREQEILSFMSAEETFFYNSPKIVIDTSHAELIHFLFSISHDILKILALLILTGCPDNFGQGTGQYSLFKTCLHTRYLWDLYSRFLWPEALKVTD